MRSKTARSSISGPGPTSRFRLIVGFYLGAVLKTLFYGCLLIASIWLAGVLKGASPDVVLLPRLLGALFFSALTFCAGGLFLATLTGKYMIWGIAYGAAFEMGVGRLPTNISQLTLKHHIEAIGGFGVRYGIGNSFHKCSGLLGCRRVVRGGSGARFLDEEL